MNVSKILNQLESDGKPIAFILGNNQTTGLGVVRSLGRKGIPVLWLDLDPKNVGFLSRYIKGFFCPHPRYEEQAYIEFLQQLGQNLSNKGILMPLGDIELIAILKNRRLLEKYFQFPVAPYDVTIKFLDKKIFYKTLENEGMPHPRTFFPNDISDLTFIEKEINYPCLVKPNLSGYFSKDFHTKLFIAKSKLEMRKDYERAKVKNQDVVIQEIIPGEADKMYGFNAYYDHTFTPVGSFMYHRIREWPHFSGNGCLIHNIMLPELEQMITPLMKKIKYFGIVDVEFKKDIRDGSFKIIEINPRIWLQNSLPTRCGYNLPYISYLDTLNKFIENPIQIENDMKWLCFFDDMRSTFRSIKNRNFSLQEWIKSFHGKKEYAVYARDDPLPFFGLFAKYIAILLFQRR